MDGIEGAPQDPYSLLLHVPSPPRGLPYADTASPSAGFPPAERRCGRSRGFPYVIRIFRQKYKEQPSWSAHPGNTGGVHAIQGNARRHTVLYHTRRGSAQVLAGDRVQLFAVPGSWCFCGRVSGLGLGAAGVCRAEARHLREHPVLRRVCAVDEEKAPAGAGQTRAGSRRPAAGGFPAGDARPAPHGSMDPASLLRPRALEPDSIRRIPRRQGVVRYMRYGKLELAALWEEKSPEPFPDTCRALARSVRNTGAERALL